MAAYHDDFAPVNFVDYVPWCLLVGWWPANWLNWICDHSRRDPGTKARAVVRRKNEAENLSSEREHREVTRESEQNLDDRVEREFKRSGEYCTRLIKR